MSSDTDQRVRPVPLWHGIGLALAAPALTWWAIGPLGRQWPDYQYGPYRVPPLAEQVVGVVAIVIAALSVLAIAVPATRRAARRTLTPFTVMCLIAAGVLGAAGWRVQTAGSVGANIGGSLLLVIGPVLIAAFLVAAVRTEFVTRGREMRHVKALTWLAALVAPSLIATQQGLVIHDQSIGVIGSADYAKVHVGDTHDQVRKQLGRPAREAIDWFFTAPPAGSNCDYYTSHGHTVYQVCYRNDVVVTAKASDGPVGN
jgi:hypothetical protein